MKTRKLKLWNGGYMGRQHVYVCAYSQNDAIELFHELQMSVTLTEIRTYWSAGAWGHLMTGIPHERGVWICPDNLREKSQRVIAKMAKCKRSELL